VVIAFRGMCAGCQVSELTRRDFIQARLREAVAPTLTVVEEGKA
jgi:Fe-S cluster biogenesis protein NfuA